MWHQRYGPAPWTMIVIGGVWLALILTVVGVAVWLLTRRGQRPALVRAAGADASGPQQYPSPMAAESSGPLTILQERLARGEIDVDTYRALHTELAPTAQPAHEDSPAARPMPPPG